MATKQGWQDFNVIIPEIEYCIYSIRQLSNEIKKLESNKAKIVDDPDRLADLKKILDIHPDYSVTGVRQRITKLSELKTWLEDNGYIS